MYSGEMRDMDRLPTRVDRSAEDFARRREFNLSLIEDLSLLFNTAGSLETLQYVNKSAHVKISFIIKIDFITSFIISNNNLKIIIIIIIK